MSMICIIGNTIIIIRLTSTLHTPGIQYAQQYIKQSETSELIIAEDCNFHISFHASHPL